MASADACAPRRVVLQISWGCYRFRARVPRRDPRPRVHLAVTTGGRAVMVAEGRHMLNQPPHGHPSPERCERDGQRISARTMDPPVGDGDPAGLGPGLSGPATRPGCSAGRPAAGDGARACHRGLAADGRGRKGRRRRRASTGCAYHRIPLEMQLSFMVETPPPGAIPDRARSGRRRRHDARVSDGGRVAARGQHRARHAARRSMATACCALHRIIGERVEIVVTKTFRLTRDRKAASGE